MLILKICLSLSAAIIVAEILSRLYWKSNIYLSMRRPSEILYSFYPGLKQIHKAKPSSNDTFFNILILGASALGRQHGEVEKYLSERLVQCGHANVRIFNLSTPGHTSRDSLRKYVALAPFYFDLVLLYPGGADTKVNNAPPEIYKDDYSHFAKNEIIDFLAYYHGRAFVSLPYTLYALILTLRYRLNKKKYVPFDKPRNHWVSYGVVMRSVQAVRDNTSQVIALAKTRKEKLILMTSAFHSPKNYSLEALQKKQLDYVLHTQSFETLGDHRNVTNTLLAHNELIRELAKRHFEVSLVDQEKLMANHAEFFNDPFHFTVVGSIKFVDNVLPAILSAIKSQNIN